MLRQLPNSLTVLRILMVAPLGLYILRQEFTWALAVCGAAGFTDALDGFLARRLDARTRLGAILDPLADKILITVSFLCFAQVGLIPWWLAILVITRDIVIITGACCYRLLIGEIEFSPLRLSKMNMAVQLFFCVLLLAAQVAGGVPTYLLNTAIAVVVVMAISSGLGYVLLWSRKALADNRERPGA